MASIGLLGIKIKGRYSGYTYNSFPGSSSLSLWWPFTWSKSRLLRRQVIRITSSPSSQALAARRDMLLMISFNNISMEWKILIISAMHRLIRAIAKKQDGFGSLIHVFIWLFSGGFLIIRSHPKWTYLFFGFCMHNAKKSLKVPTLHLIHPLEHVYFNFSSYLCYGARQHCWDDEELHLHFIFIISLSMLN